MNLPEIPYATQETPSNLSHGKHPLLQAQEEGLSIECLRLTCVRWLAAEQRWISRDCHVSDMHFKSFNEHSEDSVSENVTLSFLY